ncbi:MAG: hypothetical protein JO269_08010 [Burkholderiaceae bacterium]|nr:hypothetical protein [Burkholderiaceae bacterium]
MNRSRYIPFALMLTVLGSSISLLGLPANAQTAAPAAAPVVAAPAETVRPEVGKPLQAAVELYKAKNYKAAMAKLGEITVTDKTPFETYTIDRIRAAIASASGDDATAVAALLSVVAVNRAPHEEQLNFILAISDYYYKGSDYVQSATWIQRYLKEGGNDPQARDMLVFSYYLNKDYAHAGEALQANLAEEEKAGVAPTEKQLNMLSNIAAQQKDQVAYVAALEKTVVYYPKKEYWTDLVNRLRTKSNYSDRMDLDFYRLKFSMGLMSKPDEYVEMTELALQAGLPAEAKKVMETGMQAGVLGSGPDADRHKRLLGEASKKAAEDLNTIAKTETEVRKRKDGVGLFNLGYVYVTNEQYDKGIALMEQGIAAGGLKHPEEAKLHLATAYSLAGRTPNAIQEFKTVQGADGSGDLARYWVLKLTHPLP